jgi:hypothetical protein
MTTDTDWQHDQLSSLAKRMVALEVSAKRAADAGDYARADDLWYRRELVQWLRSLLLRDAWASTPRDSSLVKQ